MAENDRHSTKQHNDRAGARDSTQAAADDAVHQGAEIAHQGGRAAADATRRAGDVTAEATRRGSKAGADAIQRAGDTASETMRRGAEAFAEGQREFLEKAAQQFEAVSRKVAEAAQDTAEDMRTLLVLPRAANGGLQDLQQSVTGLVEGVVRTNLRATQELFQLANPGALVELQQRFVREYLDTLMQGTALFVRATRRTADETLRPLEQQIEQRRQAVANEGQRYQHAAE
jgi:hypothetical protein